MTLTQRQERWTKAAEESAQRGNDRAAALFALIALPNDSERSHHCREHAQGFRRDGRRGFKCGICGHVIRWLDEREEEQR